MNRPLHILLFALCTTTGYAQPSYASGIDNATNGITRTLLVITAAYGYPAMQWKPIVFALYKKDQPVTKQLLFF